VKARKVKGLDPAGALGDNAERIVRVRLGELYSFMPRAADPAEVAALHDMRIAAKRLRYILEITHPCFGPYAEEAVKDVKQCQEVLGEVHDCDEQLPEVRAFLDGLVVADAEALLDGASDPPHRDAYAGLVALTAELLARREREFRAFLDLWQELERDGFRARLEYAICERSGGDGPATIDDQ
jgi:CHAD domain-containing protein